MAREVFPDRGAPHLLGSAGNLDARVSAHLKFDNVDIRAHCCSSALPLHQLCCPRLGQWRLQCRPCSEQALQVVPVFHLLMVRRRQGTLYPDLACTPQRKHVEITLIQYLREGAFLVCLRLRSVHS